VQVIYVSEEKDDFIIFEVTGTNQFKHCPIGSDSMYFGQRYVQLAVDQDRKPVCKEGTVSKEYGMLKFLIL
jgi:hypothetical protein